VKHTSLLVVFLFSFVVVRRASLFRKSSADGFHCLPLAQ